jgi:hypothetical protein
MRLIFNTIDELVDHIRDSGNTTGKKIPYKVTIDGTIKYVLSGNPDTAVAAVSRQRGAEVEQLSVATMMRAG